MKRLNALLPRRYALFLERGLYRVIDMRSRQWIGEWPDLASLQAGLVAKAAPTWRRDTVDIVISDAQSRSVALKRPRGIRTAGELAAVHRARFESLFGEGKAWQIRLQDQSPSAAHPEPVDLVVGLPDEWMASMLGVCAELRWTPRRIVPRWLIWADRWSRHWGKSPHWLVVADKDCVTLALFSQCRCLSVRQQRNAALAIEDLLARESALLPPLEGQPQVWMAGTGLCTDLSRRPHETQAEDLWAPASLAAITVREIHA